MENSDILRLRHYLAQPGRSFVIAIDGPSGSGKTTTARGLAKILGIRYLDTGAMYRAVAIAYRDAGLGKDQVSETVALAQNLDLAISTDPNDFWIRLAGRDVTAEIREPKISQIVSQVAVMIPVREVLRARQRQLIGVAPTVAEGRDITTVVAPDAQLRVLLTADPQERMLRRRRELRGSITSDQLQDQIIRRDRDDSQVAVFTQAADGVVTIDSTYLTLDQVISQICSLACEKVCEK